jgi:transposase
VAKLRCFAGIGTHVAMVVVTGTGDFTRFAGAKEFSSCLGLCPGEHSSGQKTQTGGITKAGRLNRQQA